jgi:hypothetical protein
MRFPQAYLFVNRDPSTFDPAAIEAWANGSPIYIQGHTKRSRAIEKRIALLSLAAYSLDDAVGDKTCVVVSGTCINEMLILGLESTLSHLYWIDGPAHVSSINQLIHARHDCWQLQSKARNLIHLHDHIRHRYGDMLDTYVYSDEAALTKLYPFVEGKSEIEILVRTKLKSLVRKGIVNRIDLQ